MDSQMILLGRILGEVYRLQERSDKDDAQVFGLRNGMEYAIEQELLEIGFVSKSDTQAIEDALDELDKRHRQGSGAADYYSFESGLTSRGIGRSAILVVFEYLLRDSRFADVIHALAEGHAAIEIKGRVNRVERELEAD